MEQLDEYEPREFEEQIYEEWMESGCFEADNNSDKPSFSMVIPPPNVTGELHMGHALNSTLQDVLARWKRMKGHEVLWVPGTDHAGIATQNKVEQQLAEEGTNRHELGREQFLERVWEWKQEYGDKITHQLENLGVSCDWSRERFTMDDGLSNAVKEVFIQLYEDDLIYRGDYIVNWCPRCGTALSDIEVEYPLTDKDDTIEIATTRPETMLGDTAVAFHPSDERYQHLEGKTVTLPLVKREIPIISDNRVDPDFGSGLVKVTPAHDDLDFRIGQDNDLEIINLLNEDGTFNESAGERYAGLDREDVRQTVVEDLRRDGSLIDIEAYRHEVGHCYRCDNVIEPFVSKQWFVSMETLAEPAIEAVREDEVEFHPERWENTYFEWMENIRDWCISRQIWWGHRIPVWYGPDDTPFVARSEQEAHDKAREHYGEEVELEQDEDVLDTWFSSALWPFSTLGWPEQTEDLEKFYPTGVLSTAFDIIYFWVARMIMMGYYCMDEKPFSDVYIHALIRDEHGDKMSKSVGNVIDPLDMIDDFGCDPLRFTLCALAVQGRDIKLSPDRIEGFRNFSNKLWNAAKYVQFAVDEADEEYLNEPIDPDKCEDVDLWIMSRFKTVIQQADEGLENYDFDQYADSLYQFLWHEFCDWYIELSKIRLDGEGEHPEETKKVLYQVLVGIVKGLQPVVPFITEKIHRSFDVESGFLMEADWPQPPESWDHPEIEGKVENLQELIRAGRHLKKEFNVQTDEGVRLQCSIQDDRERYLADYESYVQNLAGIESLTVDVDIERPEMSTTEVLDYGSIYLPLEGIIDVDRERERIEGDIEDRRERIGELEERLDNSQFIENAPQDVIDESKEELEQVQNEITRLEETLDKLKQDAPAP
ncbi:MAG: valine--tRNA ligase [bacterium]